MNYTNKIFWILILVCIGCGSESDDSKSTPNDDEVAEEQEVPISDDDETEFSKVQPMTGIVVWDGNSSADDEAHALEYSYMLYNDIVSEQGLYDWAVVENKLDGIASRNHQAILRFRFAYVGQLTSVPEYIKNLPDYIETKGLSEDQDTWFPDWTNQELKDFTLEFYEKFAEKYDDDPRLAFLQVGFGLWAEYHIYDGPFVLGSTFPSKEFQSSFLKKLDAEFDTLHWSISIDAEDTNVSPLRADTSLLDIPFGIFDDSFMSDEHGEVNEPRFGFFGVNRYQIAPAGGEFSYYTDFDQRNVLSENGAHGESYESFASRFHISYMIGNDQYRYQSKERIKEASINTGYKFEVLKYEKTSDNTVLTVKNIGTAPIYYDAYFSIKGTNSNTSLKTLMPGQESEFTINYVGDEALSIVCNRLLSSQIIDFKKSY